MARCCGVQSAQRVRDTYGVRYAWGARMNSKTRQTIDDARHFIEVIRIDNLYRKRLAERYVYAEAIVELAAEVDRLTSSRKDS